MVHIIFLSNFQYFMLRWQTFTRRLIFWVQTVVNRFARIIFRLVSISSKYGLREIRILRKLNTSKI
jgi:hypothetical protein